ncbi:MAG: endonuclease III [Alphaproteobacteria bacterium]|nr:endonuclease III [Alphaproteobacteria bacterium]
MKPADADEFFRRLASQRPDPKTELNYVNPYTLLVAAVLSAQATDVGVNKATASLFTKVKTPKQMLAFGEARLKDRVKSIGLYNAKCKNIMAFSKILVEKFKGEIPRTLEELTSLPGVGRKTANIILNVAYGEPVIAVDTHAFRVANRTGLAPGKTPREVEDKLMKAVPDKWKLHAHHWIILHGRYVCVARKPKCPECIVRDLCAYKDKTV